MGTPPTTRPRASGHFTSSILLWVRADQPRQTGMDHWKGPHSGIISASPGLEEYRQIHLAEHNPGRWPASPETETAIPADRKIDGIAEVTFQSVLAPLLGRKQTALAYADEINVFRRTLLYGGTAHASRWWDVNATRAPVGARAVIYLRRRPGVSGSKFRTFVTGPLVSALNASNGLRELRTQTFLPWTQRLWNTPNVAHDNPRDQRFQASVIIGFADDSARDEFYAGATARNLAQQLTPVAAAVHAYDVSATLTFVRDGHILPHVEN